MPPRSTKIIKKSGDALSKLRSVLPDATQVDPDAEQVETESREADSDEGKFGRLGADFVLRQNNVPRSSATTSADHTDASSSTREFSSVADGFIVRKGDAGPSVIGAKPGEFSLALISNGWEEPRAIGARGADSPPQASNSEVLPEDAHVKAALAERENTLALANLALARTRERGKQDIQEALSKAELAWRAEEEGRLAAAEAIWQDKFEQVLAEVRAQTQSAHGRDVEIEFNRMREELAAMQTALADRENALARADVAIEQTRENAQQDVQDALRKAEQAWKANEVARIAEVEAQWQEKAANAVAQARAQGQAHNQTTERELNQLREEKTAMQAALADRENALARADVAIEQARERATREIQEALEKAEQAWKTNEAARLAAVEAQWHEKSTNAVAQARAQVAAVRNKASERELTQLREELVAMQAALSDHETALARADMAIEQTRDRAQQDVQEALSSAETVWKANEAARLATAEAHWHEKSTNALAQARAQELSHNQSTERELTHLRGELAALQATLADREAALAREYVSIERARESVQREAQEALARAETVWKANEAARLAAAEVQWHEKSASALAEARAGGQTPNSDAELEASRLRAELAAMQATLADREMALAREYVNIEHTREGLQREAKESLSKAELAWKAGESARLAAAEAQWQERAAGAVAEARAASDSARDQATKLEFNRLRRELTATQAMLAHREAALTQANLMVEQSRETRSPKTEIVLKQDRIGFAREALESPADTKKWPHPIRDLIVAASLAVAAISSYPYAASFLPDKVTRSVGPALMGDSGTVTSEFDDQSLAIVARATDVHTSPSADTRTIAMLERGSKVTILQQDDSWTLVQIAAEKGKTTPRQGWVSTAALNGPRDRDKKSPPALRK